MSFDDKEHSSYDGAPVELFLFEDDLGLNRWAVTTGDAEINVDAIVYAPGIIKRSSIKQSANDTPGVINVEVPGNDPIALQFRAFLPARPISLRVFKYHRTDGEVEKKVAFIGTANSVKFNMATGMASISCYPITKTSLRRVPWQVYKKGCNWALYGNGCAVLRSSFEVSRPTLNAVDGDTIQSTVFSGYDDGWFTNGYVQVIATGEVRFITEHVGDTIRLIYPYEALTTADEVNVYPGCDRTAETCRSKFDNIVNYLGFDYIPSESPFEDPIDGTLREGGGGGGINPRDRRYISTVRGG